MSYTTLASAPAPLYRLAWPRALLDLERRRLSLLHFDALRLSCLSGHTMSELQSFFGPKDQTESQTRDDLPKRVSKAAKKGDLDTVRRWLAAGGSPDAAVVHEGSQGTTISLLEAACGSGRPSNAEIVGLLCAAGANEREDKGRSDKVCA